MFILICWAGASPKPMVASMHHHISSHILKCLCIIGVSKKIFFVFGGCKYFILLIADTYNNNHATCNMYIYIHNIYMIVYVNDIRIYPSFSGLFQNWVFPNKSRAISSCPRPIMKATAKVKPSKTSGRRYRENGPKCGLPSREWIHIPPWEKENHLQNAIFGGIC